MQESPGNTPAESSKGVGQHAGFLPLQSLDHTQRWVSIQESPGNTPAETSKGSGQHTGMVGHLKQE